MTEIIPTHLPQMNTIEEVYNYAEELYKSKREVMRYTYLGAVLINFKLNQEEILKFLSSMAILYSIEVEVLQFYVFSELMIHLYKYCPDVIIDKRTELDNYIATTNKNNLSIITILNNSENSHDST